MPVLKWSNHVQSPQIGLKKYSAGEIQIQTFRLPPCSSRKYPI